MKRYMLAIFSWLLLLACMIPVGLFFVNIYLPIAINWAGKYVNIPENIIRVAFSYFHYFQMYN